MVRAIDKAGLWSKPVISDKILIDHTKPGIPVITSRQYNTSKTEIGGIQFASGDPESGITHYRLGVVTQPGTGWLATQVRPINQFGGQLDGLNLTEAGVYYLAMQTQNGAGDWSDIGYSAPVTVDTLAPVLKFTRAGSIIVTNAPPLAVEFTLSEAAQVQLNLVAGNGISTPYSMNGKPGINQFTLNESKPDIYTLTAQATDPAGNAGSAGAEQKQLIRVNAPPQIALPAEIHATPGQPLNFTATVVDPDGVPGDVLTYQWNPGDDNGPLTGSNPQHRYTKAGQYTLTLTVTDKDGGVTTATTPVKIANTTRGSLYMDEVWSGVHHIYDDVTVPPGIKLTILAGTQIIIDGIPGETGYNHALIIQGSLTVQSGTSFKSVNGTVENGWKGIDITGQATLDGANIYHALRGITVMNTANVTASNCGFMDNYIGIHVYGSKPRIDHCQFINNQWYGIKEDLNGRPVVTYCGFTGNEVNYYQDQVSEITIDDLNRIPGNGGNRLGNDPLSP
jgi:parallel beta-helix repeat protein